MEYKIELGAWNSIFAVPSVIVDRHLKLAGAAQLKVLLWFLRHAGESCSVNNISSALSMQEADVRDCMQYWVQTGVIGIEDDVILPCAAINYVKDMSLTQQNESDIEHDIPVNAAAVENETITSDKSDKKRPLSRPERPDSKYIGERINSDESIAFLMRSADEILGRITSNNDKATLLLINEYDGLPVEIIIMLMQYALSIGRCNMRYIEKMAIDWADKEITTIDAAEKMIKRLTDGRNLARRVQKIIGVEDHSPTENESVLADAWINQWKFSDEMIREAYEACVDAKGKYIPKYTNSILRRWYESDIKTSEQLELSKKSRKNKQPKALETYEATYDISEYESTSVTDGEW